MACAVVVPPPEPIGDFPAWLEAQGVNEEVARAMDSELGIRDYGVLRACVGDGLVRAELLAAARDRLPFGFYAVLRQVVKALRGAEPHDAETPRWDDAACSPCGDVTLAGLVEVLLALFSGLSRELLLSARRLEDADDRKYMAASPSSVGVPGTENAAMEADGLAEDGNERPYDEKTSDMASNPSYFFPSRIKVESPPHLPHDEHGEAAATDGCGRSRPLRSPFKVEGREDERIAAGPSEPACRAAASRAHAAAQRSRVTVWGPRNGGAGEQQQEEEEAEEEAAGSSTTSAFPLPLGFGPSGMGPLKLGPLGMGPLDLGPSGMGPSGLRHSGLGTLGMGPSRLGPSGLRSSALGYSELGYSELGYSELGPSGLRPSQSRPSGLEPSGLEPSALGYSELGPTGMRPSAPGPSRSQSSVLGPPGLGHPEPGPSAPGHSRWAPSNRGKRPPLSCAVCERTFLLKTNLTVHLRTHTGERPFHCTACDRRFAHVSNLKRHRRKYHDA